MTLAPTERMDRENAIAGGRAASCSGMRTRSMMGASWSFCMQKLEKLRRVAFFSIGRAVGYSGLGIFVVMVGLSYDPVLALRSGGVLLLLLLAGLLLRAQRVHLADYRHTEAWNLLDKSERPDGPIAGKTVTSALREACLWFARWIAGVAAVIWVCAIIFAWAGAASRLT